MEPVHYSQLRMMALSPAHYRYALNHPLVETRAMRIGTCVHHAVLGGRGYSVFDGDRRSKDWKSFAAEHVGETILTRAEMDDAEPIIESVLSSSLATGLIRGRTLERNIEWSYCGRSCSSTPDAFSDNAVVELKVSVTSEPERFGRLALRMGYHAQLAFYRLAIGAPQAAAYIVCVESKPPCPVTVLELSPAVMEVGEKMCRAWMERLLVCEASNEWPGYAQGIVPLALPEWMSEDASLIIDGEEVQL